MTKTMMKKYAALIARVGANVQKGQVAIIYASVDQAEFVSYVAEECYKAGASRVDFEWDYQPLTKMAYKYRTLKSLSVVPAWKEEKLKQMVEEIPCRIRIESDDPDMLLSDNFFDMNPGQKRVKVLRGSAENLRVRCVYDAVK